MAHSAMSSLSNHEAPRTIPRTHVKIAGNNDTCLSRPQGLDDNGERDRRIPGVCWSANVAESENCRLSEKLSQKTEEDTPH